MLYFLLFSCVAAAALFALIQVAFFSLTPVDLKVTTHASSRRKRQIKRLLDQPRDLLVTVLFCEVSAAIILQNSVARLFGDGSSWWITVGVPIVLTLFLGEILPKSLALPYRAVIASYTAPFMLTLRQLLSPLCRPITRFGGFVSHLIFPHLKPNQQITPEEVDYLINLSKQGGVIDETEALWLHNYLALSKLTVKEKMHPRDELVWHDIASPEEQLKACFAEQSDIPICRKDLQDTIGVLDATTYLLNQKSLHRLCDLVTRPYFVPETLPLVTLFSQWLSSNSRLCLVVDEYGVITGWLHRNDLMRMILSSPKTKSLDLQHPYLAPGKMELAEFHERFDVKLDSPHNMTTLGGWMIEKLGDIPKKGTTLSRHGFLFQVVEAEPNKIISISIKQVAK